VFTRSIRDYTCATLQEEQPLAALLPPLTIHDVAYNPCSQDLSADYTCATLQEEQSLAVLLSPLATRNVPYGPCSRDLALDHSRATLQEEQSLAALLFPSGKPQCGLQFVFTRSVS